MTDADKKIKVSIILKEIETMMHKMVDEKRDEPFNTFEFLAITMDELLKNRGVQKPLRFRIRDS